MFDVVFKLYLNASILTVLFSINRGPHERKRVRRVNHVPSLSSVHLLAVYGARYTSCLPPHITLAWLVTNSQWKFPQYEPRKWHIV